MQVGPHENEFITLVLSMTVGKPDKEVSQAQLGVIHALKETLKRENDSLKETKHQLRDLQDRIKSEEEESKVQTSLLQGNAELRERIQADEREKLEKENEAILKEKLDSLKLEIEQEKAEVKVKYCSVVRFPLVYVQLLCNIVTLQLKVAQGVEYKLEESVKMETELIELRAKQSMMALQVHSLVCHFPHLLYIKFA